MLKRSGGVAKKTLTKEQLRFLSYVNESRLFIVNETSFELVRPITDPEFLTVGAHFSHLKAFIGKRCDVCQLSVFQKISLGYFIRHKAGVGVKKRCDSVTFGLSGSRVDQIKAQERVHPRSPSAPTLPTTSPISIPGSTGLMDEVLALGRSGAVSLSSGSFSPGRKPASTFFDLAAAHAVRPLKSTESKQDTDYSDSDDDCMFRME